MNEPKHTPEEVAIYRRIAAGDAVERNRMAEQHLGLVPAVATYYAKRNPHLSMDDLLQEGRYGVVYSLDRFNVDKGYRFSTYATYWIRHFIQRFVVANHSCGLSSKRKDTEAYLGLRMDEGERDLYEQRCLETMSTSRDSDSNASFDNACEGDDPDDVEGEVMQQLDIEHALAALSNGLVTNEQRRIISMRYGVLGERPQTVPQVARRTGLRAEVVMKVEQETLDLLFELMETP